MQGNAVHDGSHAELAHAVVQVIAREVVVSDIATVLAVRIVRRSQVGGTAEQLGQHGSVRVECLLRCLARRKTSFRVRRLRDILANKLRPAGRQLAGHSPLKFACKLGESGAICLEPSLPFRLALRAACPSIPSSTDLIGDHEWFIRPVQVFASRRHFIDTERRAVRCLGSLLVRRTVSDHCLAAD